MPHRDLASWNSLLAAYNSRSGDGTEALVLFKEMMCEGIGADSITFVIIISAIAAVTKVEYGSSIHGSVIKNGFDCYVNLENAMLGMYVKYGDMNAALTLFTEMGDRRDVVSHTIMINGCIETGFIELARDIFDRWFDKDLVLWNSMISGYVESNHPNEALVLFEKMENEEVEPDQYTVVSILSACACLSDLQYACRQAGLVEEGCFLFSTLVRNYKIQPKVEHFGCLIDLLSRAGLVHQADKFVKAMDPGERLVAYKTLLSACMNHSKIDLGLKVADELKRLGSEDHAVRVLLSNFYALAGEWLDFTDQSEFNLSNLFKARDLHCLEG
ncbi:hypothetical protein C3L33_15665, partial [Rhododendron williamsianum]